MPNDTFRLSMQYGLWMCLIYGVLLSAACNSKMTDKITVPPHVELYPASNNGKWGFYDKDAHLVIPYQFDEVHFYHSGLARVKQDGKYGYIDDKGEMIIKPKYQEASNFHYTYASVKKGNRAFQINRSGKKMGKKFSYSLSTGCITPAVPADVNEYVTFNGEQYALVHEWIQFNEDSTSHEVIKDTTDYVFQSVNAYSRACILLEKDGKFAIYKLRPSRRHVDESDSINCMYVRSGTSINRIDFKYDHVNLNYQRFASGEQKYEVSKCEFKRNGKWGIVDSRGKELVPPSYQYIKVHSWNLALVEYQNAQFGYTNIHTNSEYFKRNVH